MKKYMTCFIALFSFIILNGLIIYNINNDKKDIFRLHIVSNSNSIYDLIEKLKVNENVNTYLKSLKIENLNSKEEVKNKIYGNIDNILDVANNTLKEDNVTYLATAKYGKIYYTEKEDISIKMDEGIYDSLQIILGEGNGENIWSLIFPNEEDMKNISNFETIIPGISKIYNNDASDNKIYESLILKKIRDLKKCLEKNF